MVAELKKIESRRIWTIDQKIEILEELKKVGSVKKICDKYDLHPTTIGRWKRQAEAGNKHFLGPKNPKFNQKIKNLESEIEKLRDVIVSQAHEINLLKKNRKLV